MKYTEHSHYALYISLHLWGLSLSKSSAGREQKHSEWMIGTSPWPLLPTPTNIKYLKYSLRLNVWTVDRTAISNQLGLLQEVFAHTVQP